MVDYRDQPRLTKRANVAGLVLASALQAPDLLVDPPRGMATSRLLGPGSRGTCSRLSAYAAAVVYLEDHPPARSQFRRTRRAAVTGAIVVHTAENTADITLPDGGAEAVARFISTRTDGPGSYHSVVDSDSVVDVGRYEWEMFHEGTGGNRWSLGLSFACRASQWSTLPDRWVRGAIRNGGLEAASMAAWVNSTVGVTVPARRISPTQYRSGFPGFISHGELDPGRRTDPGLDFPWDDFLTQFVQFAGGERPVADWCVRGNRKPVIEESQRLLAAEGFYSGPIDADWFRGSSGALVALNNDRKLARTERDNAVNERDAFLTERDTAIGERDTAIGERDALQVSLDEASDSIAANRALITALRAQVAELEQRDPEATARLEAARAGLLSFGEALGLRVEVVE